MDEYYKYIDQLGSSPNPSGDGTLADLKLALSTDDPAEYYPVGTEIEDTYDGHSNPLIVAQYLDSSNNSRYSGAEGVILIRKYVEPTSQTFGDNPNYPNSNIDNFLKNDYYAKCSAELQSFLSDITIPYRTTYLTRKWFIMSSPELYGTTDPAPPFEYWKQRTGLQSPSTASNQGRIMTDRQGTVRAYWLRSYNDITTVYDVIGDGAISRRLASNSEGVLPACFIAKSAPVADEALTSAEYDN